MKPGFVLLVPICLLPACGGSLLERPANPQDGTDTVQVVLEQVQVRQYIGDQLRFQFEALRVVLDEKGEVVNVSNGVWGRIEDSAWEDRSR